MPAEAVESLLVTFDTLAGIGGDAGRPDAARWLREAAEGCADPLLKERLLRAAGSVAAGEPCALTPEGLTGSQAAAAQTMTLEQWQAQGGDPAIPVQPEVEAEEELGDESEEETGDEWEGELPVLPQLRVRHFFSGLVVRVRQEFLDADRRMVPADQTLRLLTSERSGGVHTLVFKEGACRLDPDVPQHASILENIGNAWFQPAPSAGCLQDLCEAILERLRRADDLDEEDDDRVETLYGDVETCQDWLIGDGNPPAPAWSSAPFAAKVFGRQSEVAAWVTLLAAGLAHCRREA
jgi:hypothetical protein